VKKPRPPRPLPHPPPTWAEFLDSLGCAQEALISKPVLSDVGSVSPEAVAVLVRQCKSDLGWDTVLDAAKLAELGIRDIEPRHYEANDIALLQGRSLDIILEDAIRPHRVKGQSEAELRLRLEGLPSATRAVDVLANGARKFMKPSFVPNGGRQFSLGRSYESHRSLINHAVAEVAEKGRCLIFSMDALIEAGCMHEIHTSPFTHAEKAGDPKGRVCHNLSKRTSSFPSVNESIDFDASDACYPMPTLPLLPDIAEMACKCKEANPGKQIAGGTIDVNAAYQQFAQSVETAKLVASQVKVPHGDGWRRLVVIYTVGTFGHSRAGNVYCAIGSAISERHNQGLENPRSCTYIDDGILVSPGEGLGASMEEYKAEVVAAFGQIGVKAEKVKSWESKLEAIGWDFDFVTWRVQPKMRGLAKLVIVLFDLVPVGSRSQTMILADCRDC